MLKTVSIQISAIDRLTAPAAKMRESLHRLGEPARKINAAVGRLGEATGATKLAGKFKALGRQVSDVRSRVGGLVGSIAGLAGVSLAGAGAGLLGGVIGTSAEFERYETVLRTITGSADKAKAAMAWVSDFAEKTPYQLAEVNDAFVRLQSYGINPMNGSLAMLGDASAATGKNLMQAVEMIADASMGEFERLKEFNIKAKTQGDIVSLMFTDKDGRERTFKAAKNDAKALQKAVLDAFQAKGYGGAMAALSRTWDGMVSNMKDTLGRFLKMIGDAGVFDFLKGRMQALLDTVKRLTESGQLQAWAKKISDEMIRVYLTLERWALSVDWAKVYQGIKGLVSGVLAFVDMVGGWKNAILGFVVVLNAGLIVSLVQLGAMLVGILPAVATFGLTVASTLLSIGAAALASPIFWVVAAIAAAAFVIVKNWGPIKAWFTGLWDGITAAAKGAWAFLTGLLKWGALFSPLGLILQGVGAIVQHLTGLDLFQVGGQVFGRLWEGFKSKWAQITAWFAGAVQQLTGWLPAGIKARMGLLPPKAAQVPAQARRIANPPAVRKIAAATAATGALALPTALAANPALTAVARPGDFAARAQVAPAKLQPASVTQQVHDTLNVTVNITGATGDAEIRRLVERGVQAGIKDWAYRQEQRRKSDLISSLRDV